MANELKTCLDYSAVAQSVILPEGLYPFRVVGFKRFFSTSDYCPVGEVELEVDGGKHGRTCCRDTLRFDEASRWHLVTFFCAVGQLEGDEPIVPDWDEIVGSEGWCRLRLSRYRVDEETMGIRNRVATYVDETDVAVALGKAVGG